MAQTDALTGLPNRRGWEQRLSALLSAARRSQRPLVVALADLDRFKSYNDRGGHQAGDDLLRTFALNGLAAIREGDTIARWGGEEFAIALPDCGAGHAVFVLDRIRHATPGDQTCSIGYATWDGMEDPGRLMSRVDQALYLAKRQGRDRLVAASSRMS